GHQSPRPAAPWGYTNTWGNDFCLLVGWFAVAVSGYATTRRTRVLGVVVLAVALVPVVYSLNRGLWIGLAVMAVAVALRLAVGGRQSIAVGESPDCPRCGNFTIGGNGQLWQLLYAHGIAGTVCYLAFFGYGLWRFRYDATPIGLAGGAALLSTFAAMLWYNALVTPLAFTMLGYALLWRNAREAA